MELVLFILNFDLARRSNKKKTAAGRGRLVNKQIIERPFSSFISVFDELYLLLSV